MEESTLITIMIVLLALLIPLLLSYLIYPDEKPAQAAPKKSKHKTPEPVKEKSLSFEEISAIFANYKSSKADLKMGIEELIKNHGKIHAKLGDLPHPDFKRYLTLIIELCNNPQADKDIIVALDHKLRTKNPKYGLNIDEAINKGLAARGF